MTQYIDKLKIGEKLDFVGPKGRLIYQRNGKFLIRGEKVTDRPRSITGIIKVLLYKS